MGGIKGEIIGSDRQRICFNKGEAINLSNRVPLGRSGVTEDEDLDREMDTIFGPDEEFDSIEHEVEKAKAIAKDYLQVIKIR